jgi:hypothetical protein
MRAVRLDEAGPVEDSPLRIADVEQPKLDSEVVAVSRSVTHRGPAEALGAGSHG